MSSEAKAKKLSLCELNKPARASIVLTGANILTKLSALVFTPIFTRLLSPYDYGVYALFMSTLSLLTVTGSLEIPGSVMHRVMQKNRSRIHATLLAGNILTLVFCGASFLLFFLINRRLNFLSFPLSDHLLFIILTAVCIINLYNSAEKFLYRWTSTLISSLIQSVTVPVLCILLLYPKRLSEYNHVSLKLSASAILLSLLAVFFLTVSVVRCIREAKDYGITHGSVLNYAYKIIRSYLSVALPMLPYYAAVSVISQTDKLFISANLGSGELASFSVAHSLGISICAIGSGVLSVLSPWIMRKVCASDLSSVRKALTRLFILYAQLIICFLSLADILLDIIAPKAYGPSLTVVYISALSALPLSLVQIMSSAAVAREGLPGVVLSGISAAAVSLLINAFILPRTSVVTSALASLICYYIILILNSVNLRRLLGEWLISPKKVITVSVLCFICAAIFYHIHRFLPLRLAFAALSYFALAFLIFRWRDIILEAGGTKADRDR